MGMYQRKLMKKQISVSGLRLGDSCSIFPMEGKKKAFTLNRNCIDLISPRYRPHDLCMSYIELPNTDINHFHYRLELDKSMDEGRFVLKTITGSPFWLNGSAAKEAYIERLDRLFIDDNKINFDPFDLKEIVSRHFEHPVLMESHLIASDLKILIEGETGTGKTHLAKMIHEKSGRTGKFIAINLSSYNSQLIESELFGHKKGSFTGAFADKLGAFHEAENGTLFLDEIDSLPIEIQTKLLTFLDNNQFRRVGEVKLTNIRARLIFASGKSLETLIEQGEFRKDFYFRMKSGHTITLPSLRNSVGKIREACQYFSLTHSVTLSQRLTDFYETLAWPGNLRQLFGHMEKKKILSRSTRLDFDNLDEELLLQSSDLMSLNESEVIKPIREVKEDYVRKVLSLCNGNTSMTARKLQITEKTVKSILNRIS
jgi:transcriptional regulator with PAS, ATPase and Fis domain